MSVKNIQEKNTPWRVGRFGHRFGGMSVPRLNQAKKAKFSLRRVVFSLGALIVLALVLILFTRHVSDSVQREGERVAREAIVRALISCYAAEGSYPTSLDYLEKSYGVIIDHNKYVVHYGVFASNVMPEVTLVRRNQGTGPGKNPPRTKQ